MSHAATSQASSRGTRPQRSPFSPVGPPLPPGARAIAVHTPGSKRAMWLTALLSLATTFCMAMVCVNVGRFINSIVDPSVYSTTIGVHHPHIPAEHAIDPAHESTTTSLFVVLVLWLIGAVLTEWARVSVEGASAQTLQSHLQTRLVRHGLELGPARIHAARLGALITLMTQGVAKIAEYRQTYLGRTIGGLLAPCLALVVMAVAIDSTSALILLCLIPIPPLLLGVFSLVTRKVSADSRQARTELAAQYSDALRGLETLSVNGSAPRKARELAATGENNRQKTMRVLAANQLMLLVIDAGFNLAFITAGVGVALWRTSSGHLTAGEAVAIVALTLLMLQPMDHIGGFFYVGMGGRAAQASLRQFLFKKSPDSSPIKTQEINAPGVHIKQARFAYPGQEPTLDNVSLDIPAGQKIAIVGRSGSGKSTLLHLIQGTLDTSEGSISTAGQTVPDQRRKHCAIVPQQTWLFTGTIGSNMRLANPDATDEQIWQCLSQAHVADEIRAFPTGLDTPTGEGGASLSGGQAQRISLARALLSGRKIVLLDEPTSHVDLDSESRMLATIEELDNSYTVIMITHRRTALRGFDRVVSLEGGRITSDSMPGNE